MFANYLVYKKQPMAEVAEVVVATEAPFTPLLLQYWGYL